MNRDERYWISRQGIRKYLATLTRPQSLGNLPKAKVLEPAHKFIERFQVADGTAAVTHQLVKLIGDFKIDGKQIHDANIVATLRAYDIPCLLTRNTKDFARFGEIITIEGIENG
jgi:hypothetical protein